MSSNKCSVHVGHGSCERNAVRDGRCIFHLDDKTEDEADQFEKAFSQWLATVESDGSAIDFEGFVFPRPLRFSNRTFSKPLSFFNATFHEVADFSDATFDKGVDFLQARFKRQAYFFHARFREKANFTAAVFESEAYFSEAIFDGKAFFEATFERQANFDRTAYRAEAYFSGTTFKAEAYFFNALFEREAYFGVVSEENLPSAAAFEKDANFFEVKFEKEVYFSEVAFGGEVCFASTSFNGEAYFPGVTFERRADFSQVIFDKEVGFFEAVFCTEADFSKTMFDATAFFQRVSFAEPQSVVFDLSDLSNVCLLHTENISEVCFRDVRWKVKGGRYRIADEDEIGRADGTTTYVNVAEIYRRLRRNYESKLRYAEAGEFFKSEMEMKRMAIAPDLLHHSKPRRVLNWLKRNASAIALYRLLSMYGESWKRIGIWIVISIPLFAFMRTLSSQASIVCFSQFERAFYENFRRSVFVFFQLRSDDLLDILERVWSGLLLGLSYVALRRQLERHRAP